MRALFNTMSLTAALGLLSATALPGVLIAAETAEHHETPALAPSVDKSDSAAASGMMQQMQAMHGKMMAAKTPAERQALMAEHMKVMQQGMQMMQQRGAQSGNGGMSSQMMQMRMNMMTMMMQMMMDQQNIGQNMGGMPMAAPTAPPSK
jgi:hypothetical protein